MDLLIAMVQQVERRGGLMDAKRETLDTLLLAWRANPDLRLGQLLESACNISEKSPSVFYATDKELAQAAIDYNAVECRRLRKVG